MRPHIERVAIGSRDDAGVAIAGHSTAPTIIFDTSPDKKLHKNRLHFDICSVDTSQDDEVARLAALGAKRVDIGQGDVSWVVMEDPVGNEFCVMRTVLPPEPEPFTSKTAHNEAYARSAMRTAGSV